MNTLDEPAWRTEADVEIATSQRRVDRRRGYDKAKHNRLSRRIARSALREVRGASLLLMATAVIGTGFWAADKQANQAKYPKGGSEKVQPLTIEPKPAPPNLEDYSSDATTLN